MANTVIVGAQWGDEGKGKVVDWYTAAADVVVRFQGGTNAGHTLVVDGRETILHLVPSGVLHGDTVCAIGPGVVVDPAGLVEELDLLESRGRRPGPDRLLLSRTAHLILPSHRRLDQARERAAGAGKIGTTGKGIGPAYEALVGRRGVRFCDLDHPERLRARLERDVFELNLLLRGLGEAEMTVDEILEPAFRHHDLLAPYLTDVGRAVRARMDAGASVLFEGAQGTLLDVFHGTYPFVTSSSTLAANAALGTGLGPTDIDEVVGITKAYCTRVGSGPFPTELTGSLGEQLRAEGHEYGATTGRPRRCGWLDIPALRYARRVNGLSAIALTKLDVLGIFDELKVCVGYRWRGETLDEIPTDPVALEEVEPVYETVPGWAGAALREARTIEALPAAARAYIERIEEWVDRPVRLVSVGPGRKETIVR